MKADVHQMCVALHDLEKPFSDEYAILSLVIVQEFSRTCELAEKNWQFLDILAFQGEQQNI